MVLKILQWPWRFGTLRKGGIVEQDTVHNFSIYNTVHVSGSLSFLVKCIESKFENRIHKMVIWADVRSLLTKKFSRKTGSKWVSKNIVRFSRCATSRKLGSDTYTQRHQETTNEKKMLATIITGGYFIYTIVLFFFHTLFPTVVLYVTGVTKYDVTLCSVGEITSGYKLCKLFLVSMEIKKKKKVCVI